MKNERIQIILQNIFLVLFRNFVLNVEILCFEILNSPLGPTFL